ncbi:MAG: hypothetical protein WCG85_08005 [Polyangia bacterium]
MALARDLRRQFPFHIQGSFVAESRQGDTMVVVAEPPPHAVLDTIQQRLGALTAEVNTTRLGYDGWVKDVVAVIGRTDRAALDDAIARLDGYLYGTSYRARAMDRSPVAQGNAAHVRLDLAVSPAELREWVLGDKAVFHAVDGSVDAVGPDLARMVGQGVFRSAEPGIVVWALPTGADLCEHAAEAREFALESDLVLAARGESPEWHQTRLGASGAHRMT